MDRNGPQWLGKRRPRTLKPLTSLRFVGHRVSQIGDGIAADAAPAQPIRWHHWPEPCDGVEALELLRNPGWTGIRAAAIVVAQDVSKGLDSSLEETDRQNNEQ